MIIKHITFPTFLPSYAIIIQYTFPPFLSLYAPSLPYYNHVQLLCTFPPFLPSYAIIIHLPSFPLIICSSPSLFPSYAIIVHLPSLPPIICNYYAPFLPSSHHNAIIMHLPSLPSITQYAISMPLPPPTLPPIICTFPPFLPLYCIMHLPSLLPIICNYDAQDEQTYLMKVVSTKARMMVGGEGGGRAVVTTECLLPLSPIPQ